MNSTKYGRKCGMHRSLFVACLLFQVQVISLINLRSLLHKPLHTNAEYIVRLCEAECVKNGLTIRRF